jgi:hypothetical protein
MAFPYKHPPTELWRVKWLRLAKDMMLAANARDFARAEKCMQEIEDLLRRVQCPRRYLKERSQHD